MLAYKIMDLLNYTRKATSTDYGAFGLKERLLYCLINEPLPPRELMDSLGMVKSNLAILAKKCLEENLIEKHKRSNDKRTLMYALTDTGRDYIEERLREIDKKFATVLTDESETEKAENTLDAAIELLSYLP